MQSHLDRRCTCILPLLLCCYCCCCTTHVTGCNRTLLLDSAVGAGAQWTPTSGDATGCSGPTVAVGITCTTGCTTDYVANGGYRFTCDARTVTWGPNEATLHYPNVEGGCAPLVVGVTGCNRTLLLDSAVGAGAKWTPTSGDAAGCSRPIVAVGITCTTGCTSDYLANGGYNFTCDAHTVTWGPNKATLHYPNVEGGCAPLVVGVTGCNRTLLLNSAVGAGAKWTPTSGDAAGCSGPIVGVGTTCTAGCTSDYGGGGYRFTCDARNVTWGPNEATWENRYVQGGPGCTPLVLGVTGCNSTWLLDNSVGAAAGAKWTPTSGDDAGCSGALVAAPLTCHADCASDYEGPGYDYRCDGYIGGPLVGTVGWGFEEMIYKGCARKDGGTSCDGDGLDHRDVSTNHH
jgi:hypothetical protein